MFQAPTPNKYKQNYIECIWVLSSEIFFFKFSNFFISQ